MHNSLPPGLFVLASVVDRRPHSTTTTTSGTLDAYRRCLGIADDSAVRSIIGRPVLDTGSLKSMTATILAGDRVEAIPVAKQPIENWAMFMNFSQIVMPKMANTCLFQCFLRCAFRMDYPIWENVRQHELFKTDLRSMFSSKLP